MKQTETISDLAAALVAAQSEMPAVGKSGNNAFDKYTYAKLEDYVKVIRPIFAKHGLSMVTSVEAVERLPNRTTKNGGTEFGSQVKIDLTIMHKSGQFFTVSSFGEGQDRTDKSIYKAITGARKYALASALGLATSDDPEAFDPEPPPVAPPATPPKPKPMKVQLANAVSKWSGISSTSEDEQTKGDFKKACADAIRYHDKTWTKIDDTQAALVLGTVNKAIDNGVKFAGAVGNV